MTTPQAIPRPRIRVAGSVSPPQGSRFLLNSLPGAVPWGAYSMRALASLWTGPCLKLKRSSDNAEQEIGFSNNEIDLDQIETFLGGATGYIVAWYDQSGSGNHLVVDDASRVPQIDLSSGYARAYFNGNAYLWVTNGISVPPFEVYAVTERHAGSAIFSNIRIGDYRHYHFLEIQAAGVNALSRAGGSTYTSTAVGNTGAKHISSGHWEATNKRTAAFNGTLASAETTNVSPSSIDRVLVGLTRKVDSRTYYYGFLDEMAIFNSVLSDRSRSICWSNQGTYHLG